MRLGFLFIVAMLMSSSASSADVDLIFATRVDPVEDAGVSFALRGFKAVETYGEATGVPMHPEEFFADTTQEDPDGEYAPCAADYGPGPENAPPGCSVRYETEPEEDPAPAPSPVEIAIAP